MKSKPFDLIIFGASSFVGQILCRNLVETYGLNAPIKWAIAGRSLTKLKKLASSLGEKAKGLKIIQAHAGNKKELKTMAEQARVILSTVGPYALYGETLIQACVEAGTDYCDLTGEVPWMAKMIRQYEAQAQRSGARIIHGCGFDSIPSDLGVYFLQQQAKKQFGHYCNYVKMRVKGIRGGFSGGTLASLFNMMKEAEQNPQLRKDLANPYLLCPADFIPSATQPKVTTANYDTEMKTWLAPFVMADVNTRVVLRSNALLQPHYGLDFKYEETLATGGGLIGRITANLWNAGLKSFMVLAALKPSRWLLENHLMTQPGKGPSPKAQEKGFFDLRFLGTSPQGNLLQVKVTGDRDPGYGSTAKMLTEAGICLAKECSKKAKPGGFWTPATMFGLKLIKRLRAHAGLSFELIPLKVKGKPDEAC